MNALPCVVCGTVGLFMEQSAFLGVENIPVTVWKMVACGHWFTSEVYVRSNAGWSVWTPREECE